MSNVEKVFRDTLQVPNQNQSTFGSAVIKKIVYSPVGLAVAAGLIVFVFLYLLNPPIIQCKKSDNDMTKPTPNTITILILSGISILAIVGCTKFIN